MLFRLRLRLLLSLSISRSRSLSLDSSLGNLGLGLEFQAWACLRVQVGLRVRQDRGMACINKKQLFIKTIHHTPSNTCIVIVGTHSTPSCF